MYEYPSGKVLWAASSYAAENPHSIEISPDGRIIAVASSTGGEVRFYNTDGKPRQYNPFPWKMPMACCTILNMNGSG